MPWPANFVSVQMAWKRNCRWTLFREDSKLASGCEDFAQKRAHDEVQQHSRSHRQTPLIRLNRVAKDLPAEFM